MKSLVEIHAFMHSMHLKMSSAKWRQFCLSLNLLSLQYIHKPNCLPDITS